jgi:hypothetical protein
VLLKLVYKLKLADPNAIWGYVQTLKTHARGSPPGVWDRPSFDTWLNPGKPSSAAILTLQKR